MALDRLRVPLNIILLPKLLHYYRAMLHRARYCYTAKSSVRLSARDVKVSWSYKLEFFQNNVTVS